MVVLKVKNIQMMVESMRMMKGSSQKIQKLQRGQFFPSVSFLGNYKLYIIVKDKHETGARLESRLPT